MGKHFDFDNVNERIGFGKHREDTLADVVAYDYGYYNWAYKKNVFLVSMDLLLAIETAMLVQDPDERRELLLTISKNKLRSLREQENARLKQEKRLKKEKEERFLKWAQEAFLSFKDRTLEELTIFDEIEWKPPIVKFNAGGRTYTYRTNFQIGELVFIKEKFITKHGEEKTNISITFVAEDKNKTFALTTAEDISIANDLFEEIKSQTAKPSKSVTPSEFPDVYVGAGDFLVCLTTFKLLNSGKYTIKNVCAVFAVIDTAGKIRFVGAPAAYCEEKNVYFILENEFKKVKKNGILMCQVITEEIFLDGSYNLPFDGMTLREMSPLKMAGYTVSASSNLSDIQRRRILITIIREGVLPQVLVLNYLSWFIELNEKRQDLKMENALQKWRSDREFIANYNLDELDKIEPWTVKEKKVIYV